MNMADTKIKFLSFDEAVAAAGKESEFVQAASNQFLAFWRQS